MNRERRLPPFAEDALALLNEAVGEADEALPKDEAKAELVADDRFTEADAEYALDLLQRVMNSLIALLDRRVWMYPSSQCRWKCG